MLVIIYSKLLILAVRQKDTKSYRPPLVGSWKCYEENLVTTINIQQPRALWPRCLKRFEAPKPFRRVLSVRVRVCVYWTSLPLPLPLDFYSNRHMSTRRREMLYHDQPPGCQLISDLISSINFSFIWGIKPALPSITLFR